MRRIKQVTVRKWIACICWFAVKLFHVIACLFRRLVFVSCLIHYSARHRESQKGIRKWSFMSTIYSFWHSKCILFNSVVQRFIPRRLTKYKYKKKYFGKATTLLNYSSLDINSIHIFYCSWSLFFFWIIIKIQTNLDIFLVSNHIINCPKYCINSSIKFNPFQLCLSLQIYYKAVRDIEAGEELLVYMKDGIFPEGSMAPNLQGKINARH